MDPEEVARDRARIVVYGLLAGSLLLYPDPIFAIVGREIGSWLVALYCLTWFAYAIRFWR